MTTVDINTEKKDDAEDNRKQKKTQYQLIRLSLTMMGIEVVFSVIFALVSPMLLMYGLPYKHVTHIWAIGPLLSFFISPIVGSLSDHCKCSYGRRRPFILIIVAFDVIGLLFIANSNTLGRLLGDSVSIIFSNNVTLPFNEFDVGEHTSDVTDFAWTVMFIILGATLCDLSSDILQIPSRAYLLDVCLVDDQAKGLDAFTKLAGCGSFLGYFLGYVDWNKTAFVQILGIHYIQIVFYTALAMLLICTALTVTASRELPPNSIVNHIPTEPKQKDDISNHMALKEYFNSIVTMPYTIKILCFTNLLCWMSHMNISLYFTHFVGEAVYKGSPVAPRGTLEYFLYEDGVRFGCIAMSLSCITSFAFSFVAKFTIDYLGIRLMYISIILIDSLCIILVAVTKLNIFIFVLCVVSGIMFYNIFTVPFILVANYHSKNIFQISKNGECNNETTVRGLGIDLACVNICAGFAQLILSLCIGQLMYSFGVTTAVMYFSATVGIIASISASQIMFL